MTNYFSAFFILFLGFFSTGFAQTVKESNSNTLLWEVSGNGLEKPSYLYGTFHMMCSDRFVFPEKLSKVLNSTEQTVLEIDFTNQEQMMQMQTLMLAEKRLTETFTKVEQERFKKGIADYGMKLEDVDQFSPIALYSMLSMKFFDCAPTEMKMLDLEIMQKTIAAGKKIDGLETVSMQAETFKKYLSPQELLKLVETFDKSKKQTNDMLNLYLKEDVAALSELMHDDKQMTKEQQKVLLDDRNINWMNKMPQMMSEKSTLFAVGAGHLVGEKGVITLLKQKGYTVKPIFN